jgi:hypothetical protein
MLLLTHFWLRSCLATDPRRWHPVVRSPSSEGRLSASRLWSPSALRAWRSGCSPPPWLLMVLLPGLPPLLQPGAHLSLVLLASRLVVHAVQRRSPVTSSTAGLAGYRPPRRRPEPARLGHRQHGAEVVVLREPLGGLAVEAIIHRDQPYGAWRQHAGCGHDGTMWGRGFP